MSLCKYIEECFLLFISKGIVAKTRDKTKVKCNIFVDLC